MDNKYYYIKHMIKLSNELGKTPSYDEFRKHYGTITGYTHNEITILSGLKPNNPRVRTYDYYYKKVLEYFKKYKQFPTTQYLKDITGNDYHTFTNHYGNYDDMKVKILQELNERQLTMYQISKEYKVPMEYVRQARIGLGLKKYRYANDDIELIGNNAKKLYERK